MENNRMENIGQLINKKIDETEMTHQVKVLFACESGSRAWGFASPDSDYDIRFIYRQSMDKYLSLWETKDTIEFMTDKDLDGAGWDLAKTLKLLYKSNVPLLEWIYSPIVYQKDRAFAEGVEKLAGQCFSPIACMYHYQSMAKNFLEKVSAPEVKLKALFYAYRAVLAGKWIVERGIFPPVSFWELVNVASNEVAEKLKVLAALKAEKDESFHCQSDLVLVKYLLETFAENEKFAPSLPKGGKPAQDMDNFFMDEIARL